MTARATDPSEMPDIRGVPAGGDVSARPCQSPEYVRLASARAGWTLLDLTSELPGGRAVVPVRRIGPLRQVVLPPFAPYSSFYAGNAASRRLLDRLESAADDLVVHFAPGSIDRGLLVSRGWTTTELRTYLIDPALGADLGTWSDSAKRNFRRYEDRFELVRDASATAAVAALAVAGYRRSGHRPPIAPDRIAPLARDVVDAGLAGCWSVRSEDGEIRAGALLLSSGPQTSYWLAGSEPGPAMTVLLGKLFPVLAETGYTEFDFVGANTPSIAEFKRRFGGQLTSYIAARRTPNPLFRLLLNHTTGIRHRIRQMRP